MSKLDSIIEGVIEEVNEIDLRETYPEDRCSEIADGAVPIYTYDVFELVPELIGYELSDPGLLGENPDIESIAQTMIYDQASNAAHQRLYERQQELEDWEAETDPEIVDVIDEALDENDRRDAVQRWASWIVAQASREWHAALAA